MSACEYKNNVLYNTASCLAMSSVFKGIALISCNLNKSLAPHAIFQDFPPQNIWLYRLLWDLCNDQSGGVNVKLNQNW